jgi:hypothetical protein
MYEALDSRKTLLKEGLTADDNKKNCWFKIKICYTLNRMGAKQMKCKSETIRLNNVTNSPRGLSLLF